MQLDTEDWFVVDLDSNPVPGDEARIRELAKAYMDRRDNFNDMARILRGLERNDSTLQGQWVEKFREKTKNLPKDLEQFADGFETVRDALSGWANLLPDYQDRAYKALVEAKRLKEKIGALQQSESEARSDLNQTKDRVDQAKRHYQDNLDDDQALTDYSLARSAESVAMTMLADYTSQLSTAEEDLAEAKRVVRTVSEEYQAEGDAVARRIDGAVGETPHFSTFQWVFYSDAWQITVKVLEIASTLLAIAALFVGGWVIALAAAAVAAALAINKLVEYALGDASWKEAAVEVFFAVVTGVSGLKVITSALKGLKGAEAAFKLTDLGNKTAGGILKVGDKAINGIQRVNVAGMKRLGATIMDGTIWGDIGRTAWENRRTTWKAAKQFGKDVAASTWKNAKTSWRHTRIQWHQLKNGWMRGGVSGTAEAAGKQFHNFLTNKATTSDNFRNLTESFTQFRAKIGQWHFNPDASGLDNIKDAVKTGWNASKRSHLWQHSTPYVLNTQDFFENWAEKGTSDAVGDQAKESVKNLLFGAIPGYDTYTEFMEAKPGDIKKNVDAIKRICK